MNDATELRAFLAMLEHASIGFGKRIDYKPPGTAVQVEHPHENEENGFTVTEWAFDENGNLTGVSMYKGEPG